MNIEKHMSKNMLGCLFASLSLAYDGSLSTKTSEQPFLPHYHYHMMAYYLQKGEQPAAKPPLVMPLARAVMSRCHNFLFPWTSYPSPCVLTLNLGGVGVPPLSHRFATWREHRGEQPATKRGGFGGAASTGCDK